MSRPNKVTQATVTRFVETFLPLKGNDVQRLYHVPRNPRYDPETAIVEQIVLSVTPTPGVYSLIGHPSDQSTACSTVPFSQSYLRSPRSLCFLHRPFNLDRRNVRKGTLVLSSHTSFDEVLTVGWNTALAKRLGVDMTNCICIQGYKGDPERRMGIIGPVTVAMQEMLNRIQAQFGASELAHGGLSDEIRFVTIMNAFNEDEVHRVLQMAQERQPRVSGLEAAKALGMSVVCVGHRQAEDWGIRYMGEALRKAFPNVHVEEVYEEEVMVVREKKCAVQKHVTHSHEIPPALRQLFSSSMSPPWRIASPYCLALAPHVNNQEPVWYVGCKTLDGEDKQFFSQTYFDVNYPDLARWSKSFSNAARSCFITFGQNFSYFACAQGRGSIWAGIPSDLEAKVRKSNETPTCVSLGAKNAWFLMYPDRRLAWDFHGHYSILNKIIVDAAPGAITYVAISPYHQEHFFVAFHDGSVKYNFQGGPPQWTTLMNEVFSIWNAQRLGQQHVINSPSAQAQVAPYAHVHPQRLHTPVHLQPQSNGVFGVPPSPIAIHQPPPPPAPNTPMNQYIQPAQQGAVQNVSFPYKAPEHGISMIPVELPGDTIAPLPKLATIQLGDQAVKKRQSFLSKLF
ncbi:hypothetical protein yc1106_09698 [Curvularia clavata]|uniref:Uncharacterized protein n=1 Tax=Curvularia clavata TaxID=95742 RepID=A0A9Q8ZGT7_CURCL|nr:hypothetical protein yc1106_09698 [Curvularia clavata]